MLGALYAILASASFGFTNASARRGVLTGTALQGLVISIPLGILIFVIGATLTDEWRHLADLPLSSIGFLSAAGFMQFVWGRYFNMRALAAVGSNVAGPVQQIQLLLALILAIVFLGETLTPLKVFGILLIVSAPAYILRQRAKENSRQRTAVESRPAEFKPRMLEGIVCALLTALGFGSSAVLIKAGLGSSNLSFLGGFIAYAAAVVAISLVLFLPSKLQEVQSMNRESFKWFMFSGIGVSVSHMFRFLALGIAPVTIVQPLHSLSLMFRIVFGYFLNREHERFDRYVLIGVFLSFVGALSLSISSDFVLQQFDLPAWVETLARWTWP